MSRLALFFTRGVALTTWRDIGSMERECRMYQHLARRLGDEVVLVTYGGRQDRALGRRVDGLRVVANTWGLPRRYYLRKLSLPWQGLGGVSVVKTNQFNGSEAALGVARRLGATFICRCGYFPSTRQSWLHGEDSERAKAARRRENDVFAASDWVAVTTPSMARRVAEDAGVGEERVFLVPNFVDTELFAPRPGLSRRRRVLFVGRLEDVKNLQALIDALAGLEVDLWIAGSGSQERELRRRAGERAVPLRMFGNLRHDELAEVMAGCQIFVLPSHYEHHPKALMEAMASGLACVGSDVYGIRDLIEHGKTGLLAAKDADGLRQAVKRLLASEDLRDRLGAAARQAMADRFSFEAVARCEEALMRAAGLRLSGER